MLGEWIMRGLGYSVILIISSFIFCTLWLDTFVVRHLSARQGMQVLLDNGTALGRYAAC